MKETYLDIQPVCMSVSTGIRQCLNGGGLELPLKGRKFQNGGGGIFERVEGSSQGFHRITSGTKIWNMQ